MKFIVWRVQASMGSWGRVASGVKSRQIQTDHYPTKSAILGIAITSVGIPLNSDEAAALESNLGFAYKSKVAGQVWTDFHTVQSNKTPRTGPYNNRKEELFGQDGTTITAITHRDYVSDVDTLVCLYQMGDTPLSLEQIQEALLCPKAAPFVGRRSCPVTAAFSPTIVEAANPVEALQQASLAFGNLFDTGRMGYEGNWDGLTPVRTEQRRDQPANRRAWSFNTRTEHVI